MSTKPGPERAEHLDHCKETMQQRDRNPARPNGPQDDVNALQGTKFHGQTNDPSQNTLCTWEGEPRKKEGRPKVQNETHAGCENIQTPKRGVTTRRETTCPKGNQRDPGGDSQQMRE